MKKQNMRKILNRQRSKHMQRENLILILETIQKGKPPADVLFPGLSKQGRHDNGIGIHTLHIVTGLQKYNHSYIYIYCKLIIM